MYQVIQFPEKEKLVEMLTPVVAEEWAHFEMVIEHLKKRGYNLGRARKDEYVVKLNGIMKKGGSRDEQLVERLLMNALIEARSCERFKLLWKKLKDHELQQFYHDLMVSEAVHYHNFIELSNQYLSRQKVQERWNEFLRQEAIIIRNLETRPDRMH